MTKLEKYLLQLTVFLIPANLSLHWYHDSAYVSGSLVDYLLPRFYLSDLPILTLIALWLSRPSTRQKFIHTLHRPAITPFLLLLALLFIRTWFTPAPLASLWYWGKLVELGIFLVFLLILYPQKQLVRLMSVPLLAALSFQSIIGLYQYIYQKSLFGYFFLGEPHLELIPTVAKSVLSGSLRILPYGTTPHPNILAGFICLSFGWLLLTARNWFKNWLNNIIPFTFIGLSICVLLLTESPLPAVFTLILLSLVLITRQIIRPMWIVLICLLVCSTLFVYLLMAHPGYHSYVGFDSHSIVRRYKLISIYTKMAWQHSLFGTGLNHSIPVMAQGSIVTTPAPFLQPVHQIYLLWLVETGLIGTFLLLYGLYQVKARFWPINRSLSAYPLLCILLLGLIDHYPLTLQTGQLLLVFALATFPRHRSPAA